MLLPDGSALQTHGIPMGDPLSPPIAIATCAWLERRWKRMLPKHLHKTFTFVRYLDDILRASMWDNDDLPSVREALDAIHAFEHHCYPRQLKLDEQKVATYLETHVTARHGDIRFRHWNKNYETLLREGKQRVYKHQHPNSYTPSDRMLGTLIGEFTRIVVNSDDGRDGDGPSGLLQSLWEKMWELAWLTCPKGRIVKALRHVQHKFPNICEIDQAINLAPHAYYCY